MISFNVDWKGETKEFRHTWSGLVNIDQFRWMVRADVQNQLKMAHNDIGARHVRAVGMFDDELRVKGIDPKKFADPHNVECRTNFQVVDYIIDSLLDMGINPMFTTTFIPGCMADGDQVVFQTKGRVNLPKDFDEWSGFIKEAVSHYVDRYGIDVVSKWYFEVWNEPNLNAFFAGNQDDFFKLWKVTYDAIKSVDSRLKVGGPSTARGEWIEEMLDFGKANDCMPDYLITHIYNKDGEGEALSPFDGAQEDKANSSPNFAAGVIKGVYKIAKEKGFEGEIHWNEWGRSWWLCEPNRESENEAAYIVKTMAEVSQLADYFAYWCLSDVYDQGGYGKEAFHGNYGMLSLQSLKKPSYFAHELLCKLGDVQYDVEKSGEDKLCNGIVTGKDGEYQAIFYSYEQDFDNEKTVKVEMNMPENADADSIKVYKINKVDNNILTKYRKLGSPDYLKPAEIRELLKNNVLQNSEHCITINNGKMTFEYESPGVALVVIPSK